MSRLSARLPFVLHKSCSTFPPGLYTFPRYRANTSAPVYLDLCNLGVVKGSRMDKSSHKPECGENESEEEKD